MKNPSTNRTRFQQERLDFYMWWQSQKDRDQISPLKAAWSSWKKRANVKVPPK